MFEKYLNIIIDSFTGYYNYLIGEIFSPSWHNYFWALIIVSLFFYALELIKPWRKDQPVLRKDFGLDAFYMFFNFFIFSLIGFNAVSNVFVNLFNDFLALFGISNWVAISVANMPGLVQLLILFLLRDFIQWNIHRFLHRSSFLWEFHKVHHSVKQMGFAAHLRYHWMENVVYRFLEYIPLGMIGFGILDFYAVHIFALAIGHFNHSNFKLPLGPLKYIFNNPQMHIWHHAKVLPGKYGVNFGISLSIWDYLFKTNYIPFEGTNIELGFEKDESFPGSFVTQGIYPWRKSSLKPVTDDK
ncbi:MAG: sterol desaturase family protein [Bacteroidales bacterium]|nr:sterol desaturase family protein [Bacteroidales bacterium]MCF8404858.1 sterol desaturase family protein [Bacteroidales bacterium]